MNNAAASCTQQHTANGNPLSALRAVGGRIADSLKTAARSVVSSNAGMLAGLSTLVAASSGTALATEVVLRDTIHGTPATTQNAPWERGNQTLATQVPTVATYAIKLPPNSSCKLSSFSFVFGSMSSMPAPDVYDWREIFNTRNGTRTTDLRVEVFNGPATNLINRMNGDLYSRSLTIDDMRSTVPWGSTTNSYSRRAVVPYNMTTISFSEMQPIETGVDGKTIYLKICFVKLQDKSTFGCLAVANGEPVNGDIALDSGVGLYEPPSAYAAKVVADIQPIAVVQPVPSCGMEVIDGKLAVCWPESYGNHYVVQIIDSLSQTTQMGFRWEDLAVTPALSATHAKYCVDIPTNSTTSFFRLRSR
jgi:hypothetical protein